MNFIPTIIIITLLTFLPSTLYTRHILQRKHYVTTGIVIAYAIPTIIVLTLIFLRYATHVGILDFRAIMWTLILLITYILPTNIYSLFYIITKIIYHITHRNIPIINHIGLTLAIISTIGIACGIFMRHNIRVRNITITSPSLPTRFDGIRIAHITDLHIGNLSPRNNYLNKIITQLQTLKPDLLLFTGDMFNLSASEGQGLDSLFSSINAPLGRYAVMGNHDYGDYCQWPSPEAKQANLLATYQTYHQLGFNLLNDTAIYISSNSDSIGLIGVENWSKPPFHSYGNLAQAIESFTPAQFNILLTHDPIHWQSEVLTSKYDYIQLTLSGHTHSAQFGFSINEHYRWSPSQYIYTHWDGHYQHNHQHLFISRGLGYTAIPFRLGMPPEITIITLKKNN
jgi:predicted MPP superfamily phosphohydrolase